MAIKYVGAKRIQGTAAEKPEAYYVSTFSDDMDSSSGWTQVADDTAPSITGGKLVGTNIVLNNENRIHKAIGTTLSDTAWVLQAKLTIEAPNNNNGYFYPLVISNGNGDFNQATSVDMIFFLVDGSSATGYFRSQDGTTQTNVATGQGHVSTFWIDIIRDGSTMTMKGYTSEANQTSGTTSFNVNFTISGTVSGLDTIQSGASDFNTATQSWSIDWVRIFNGVTTVPAITYPAIATNTIYEETDTAKYRWWDGSEWKMDGTEAKVFRGLFMGGYDGSSGLNSIEYITIPSLGNSTDFGDLTETKWGCAGGTNGSRGLRWVGQSGSANTASNVIDYVTIATPSNATDFGDLSAGARGWMGSSAMNNNTRSVIVGGLNSSNAYLNGMDYVTVATTGNSSTFGAHIYSGYGAACCDDKSKGVIVGGRDGNGNFMSDISYITISTTGNATNSNYDMGYGSHNRYGTADDTRGVFFGGYNGSSNQNRIQYITIQSLANAIEFGDMSATADSTLNVADNTRAVIASTELTSDMEYITIQTLGNSANYGDMITKRDTGAATQGY